MFYRQSQGPTSVGRFFLLKFKHRGKPGSDHAMAASSSDSAWTLLAGYYGYARREVTWSSAVASVSLLCGTYVVYMLFIKPLLSPLRKMPGTNFIPLVGNMSELMSGQAMETSLKYVKQYGPTLRYYFMFGSERVMTADPDVLKHILITNSKNYIKPPGRLKLMKKILGDGLVMLEGSEHTMHKRLMAPSFNNSAIRKMIEVFENCGRRLTDIWETEMDEISVTDEEGWLEMSVHDDLARLTLDVIGQTAFGYKFESLDHPEHEISRAFHRMLTGTGLSWRLVIPFSEKLPFEEIRQLNRDGELIQDTITAIIQAKKEAIDRKEFDSVTRDVLGMMMLARDEDTGEGLSDKELRDEVMTLMAAGHETTAVAMSWCLLLLAQHPEIQDKVRAEVMQLSPTDGSTFSWETLEEMHYLGAVIKETLRLYPPVSMTLRQSLSDDYFGSYFIPKDTITLLLLGPMMRLNANYPDAEQFKPERWLDSEDTTSTFTFLPFLIGPRMCLGFKFALLEMKSVLASILKFAAFQPIPDVEFKRKQRVTMRPHPSLRLRVSKVTKG